MTVYNMNNKPMRCFGRIKHSGSKMDNEPVIILALEAENIESRPVWKPMHLQPVFADCDFVGVDDAGRAVGRTYFSITDEEMGADDSVSGTLFSHGVCMPSDTKMGDADLVRICDVVKALWK